MLSPSVSILCWPPCAKSNTDEPRYEPAHSFPLFLACAERAVKKASFLPPIVIDDYLFFRPPLPLRCLSPSEAIQHSAQNSQRIGHATPQSIGYRPAQLIKLLMQSLNLYFFLVND
jgi:hypothetical protein